MKLEILLELICNWGQNTQQCNPSILYETNETNMHGNYLDKNLLSTIYFSFGVKSLKLVKIKQKLA